MKWLYSTEIQVEEKFELMMKVEDKWMQASYRMIIERDHLNIRLDDECQRYSDIKIIQPPYT